MSETQIAFKSGMKSKIINCILFFVVFTFNLIPVYYQINRPFSISLFLAAFFLMPITGIVAYQLLKSLLAPALQIDASEIIISGLRRKVIAIKDVVELRIERNSAYLTYKEDSKEHSLSIDVSENVKYNHIKILKGQLVSEQKSA